jgi:hypothetical protein
MFGEKNWPMLTGAVRASRGWTYDGGWESRPPWYVGSIRTAIEEAFPEVIRWNVGVVSAAMLAKKTKKQKRKKLVLWFV